jgi:hypothetical protein
MSVEYRELGPHEVIDRFKGDQFSKLGIDWTNSQYVFKDGHTPFKESQQCHTSVMYRRPVDADIISKPAVPETVKPSEDILEEALRITGGDRQNQYGPADQDFRRTAEMWSGLFRDMLKDGVSFEPYHIAQAMILLKMSRQLHQRKRDNWVDTAGYARCGQVCDQAEQERNDVK